MKLTASQQNVWDAIKDPYYGSIDNNESLLVHMARSKKQGHATTQLGNYMLELANRVLNNKAYKNYSYRGDMVQYAVLMLLKCYVTFDPTKSNNPYAYLRVVCDSAAIQYIAKEKKQREIKEKCADRVLNGQAI